VATEAKPDNEIIRQVIHSMARRLVGKAGFKFQDQDDLEQELQLQVRKRLPKYDPNQSDHDAFVRMVVSRCATNMRRDNVAPKRNSRSVQSLDATARNESVPLAEAVPSHQHDARLGLQRRSEHEEAQLKSDVRAVLTQLAPQDQRLAEMLKSQSITEAARRLSVPRTTLYRDVRRLRMLFENTGLRKYL
jgi:RNA polymerase sigma-70 factor (ECF subfamily)